MKKTLIISLAIYCLINSYSSFAASHKANIKSINFYGGEYGNSWRGSMLYRLESMPSGVTHFTVRQSDIAFKTFLSVLLSAKHAKAPVTIYYDSSKIDGNGYTATTVIIQE